MKNIIDSEYLENHKGNSNKTSFCTEWYIWCEQHAKQENTTLN